MKDKIYKLLPNFLQNYFIYLYNKKAYKVRYGGDYQKFREEKKRNRSLSFEELKEYQKQRYKKLITFAIQNSDYYKEILSGIEEVDDIKNIEKIPILNKETLRNKIDQIVIKTNEPLGIAKTGGTTGKSLEVKYTAADAQERFAFLDDFRSRYGYELGKRTAWFSGKSLLTAKDVKKNRFWKTDSFHNVRYYSTFHIKTDYLKYFLEDLIAYKPEFIVGFPSSILEIAKYGIAHRYDFPAGIIKAVFPTAEAINEEMRTNIEGFFKTKMYDQYASSEGAPFIFECEKGNLHLELQSGVFEVLDDNDLPASSGRMILTSFSTQGTPLIRYDIGDSIVLEDENKKCTCENKNPLVKEILGRVDDFVYSPQNGKINLGNISNTLKDTQGIIRFQAVQDELNKLEIYLIVDREQYNDKTENIFLKNWIERVGEDMILKLHYVQEIPNEDSGKFRFVKNNIKHLLQ